MRSDELLTDFVSTQPRDLPLASDVPPQPACQRWTEAQLHNLDIPLCTLEGYLRR